MATTVTPENVSNSLLPVVLRTPLYVVGACKCHFELTEVYLVYFLMKCAKAESLIENPVNDIRCHTGHDEDFIGKFHSHYS